MKRDIEPIEISEKGSYYMCRRKRKMKSKEASKLASRFNQRKYVCQLCGHWHLTKQLYKD